MSAQFYCHWWLSGALRGASTVNVAVCPAVTVWFTGCVVIVGATGAGFTVSVAALLVTVPAVLLTITRKVEDRKSTRLNSSHANISYAVFCLKKKKKKKTLNCLTNKNIQT